MVYRLLAALQVGLVVALVGRYALILRRRGLERSVAVLGAPLVGAVAWGLTGGLALLVSTDLQPEVTVVRDLCRFVIVALWVLFVAEFTGRQTGARRTVAAVGVGYLAVTVLVIATDPVHGSFYAGLERRVVGGRELLQPRKGPGFWVATTAMHVVFIATAGVLLKRFNTTGYVDVRQATLGFALFMAPPYLDALNLGVVEPTVGVDVGGVLAGLLGLAIGDLLDRTGLFRATPVAADSVIDSTDDAIVVVNDRGRIANYNDAALAVAVDGDPLGRPASEALRPEVAGVLETDRGTGAELLRLDEEWYVTASVSELSGPTGTASVIVLRDVTELERQRRRLERENERLDTFTSSVSHDLRNPLSVAQGHLVALDGGDDDGEREAIAAIEESLDRMSAMIEDLLELARQGRTVGERERVALDRAARDAWRVVDTGAASLSVETDRTVAADTDRLGNLLENLFRNAVEHGSRGGQAVSDGGEMSGAGEHDVTGAVTVTVGDTESGFYVADDGPGIPEEERARVLEHGYTTSETGTGFGLSIVSEIAAAHGWSVEVDESDRGGARFDVVVRAPDDDTTGDTWAGDPEQ